MLPGEQASSTEHSNRFPFWLVAKYGPNFPSHGDNENDNTWSYSVNDRESKRDSKYTFHTLSWTSLFKARYFATKI